MSVIAGVLVSLLVIALLGILTAVLIVRAIYKRIRRSRAVNSAVLRSRAAFASGPQYKVLKLRMRLDDSLRSGRAAVDLALHSPGPRGELVRLFRRIQAEGSTLEAQLRLMGSETDATVLDTEIPLARRRVEQLEGIVRRLRSAVASGISGLSDDALAELRADVDREVTALDAGIQELHALNGYDAWPHASTSTNRLYRGTES
ncbi:hypothetical protein [Leifsonia poae]|uniref:hypothetical protein n=1 Tax=Leifsonia poae TaxID=110933 RepID=UPI003D66C00C